MRSVISRTPPISKRMKACYEFSMFSNVGVIGFRVTPYAVPIAKVTDFLTEVFHRGAQPHAIQGYRAAIVAIYHGFLDGSSFSSNLLLT